MKKKMGTFLTYSFIIVAAGLMTAMTAGCGKKAPVAGGGAAAAAAEAGAAAGRAALTFGYPVEGEAWYHVKGAFVVADVRPAPRRSRGASTGSRSTASGSGTSPSVRPAARSTSTA